MIAKRIWQGMQQAKHGDQVTFSSRGADQVCVRVCVCHIFCPWLYHRVLLQTFGDREVYRTLALTPSQAVVHLQESWLRPYRWGIRLAARPPSSYILLKQKKQFLGARPIISYRVSYSNDCSKRWQWYLQKSCEKSCHVPLACTGLHHA